jgi:hypothetical protein
MHDRWMRRLAGASLFAALGAGTMAGAGLGWAPTADAQSLPLPAPSPAAGPGSATGLRGTQAASTPVAAPMTPAGPAYQLSVAAARYGALYAEAQRLVGDMPSSRTEVTDALGRFNTIAAQDLPQGAAAYAVIAATRTPAFQAGLETAVNFMGREAVLAQIRADPTVLGRVSGALEAQQAISGALGSSVEAFTTAAERLNRMSYDSQRERWSQVRVDKPGTVALARQQQQSAFTPPPLPGASLGSVSWTQTPSARLLQAAALLMLGEHDEARSLVHQDTATCVRRQKLNMQMCLAAAGFPYEQTFCLSRHGYEELTRCVTPLVAEPAAPVQATASTPPASGAAPVPATAAPATPGGPAPAPPAGR